MYEFLRRAQQTPIGISDNKKINRLGLRASLRDVLTVLIAFSWRAYQKGAIKLIYNMKEEETQNLYTKWVVGKFQFHWIMAHFSKVWCT